MNELQTTKGFDMLAGMMGPIMPVHVPQMEFGQGIIGGFKHNLKLGQMTKATKMEAEIAEYRNRMLTANLDNIEKMTTFSQRMNLAFKAMEHQSRMMDLEEVEKQTSIKYLMLQAQERELQNKKLEVEIGQAEANFALESKLKGFQVMEAEFTAKTAELEYNLRIKAMGE